MVQASGHCNDSPKQAHPDAGIAEAPGAVLAILEDAAKTGAIVRIS